MQILEIQNSLSKKFLKEAPKAHFKIIEYPEVLKKFQKGQQLKFKIK